MPYTLCPECGLRTYHVGGEPCPRCGTLLGGAPRSVFSSAPEPLPPGASSDPIERALVLARGELGMDAALLSEIRDAHEVVLWAVNNGAVGGATAGAATPLEDTICRRLLDGTIDNAVPDVAGHPDLRDLPGVTEGPIGAYVGVSLIVGAARLYVLCCLAREARPDLGEADVRFLRGLVESVRPRLEGAA